MKKILILSGIPILACLALVPLGYDAYRENKVYQEREIARLESATPTPSPVPIIPYNVGSKAGSEYRGDYPVEIVHYIETLQTAIKNHEGEERINNLFNIYLPRIEKLVGVQCGDWRDNPLSESVVYIQEYIEGIDKGIRSRPDYQQKLFKYNAEMEELFQQHGIE